MRSVADRPRLGAVSASKILLALLACAALALLGACSDSSPSQHADGADAGADADGPAVDGPTVKDVRIPGLSAAVQASYDKHGILHLYCESEGDCVAALGYFHAANRFFFMDLLRNFVRANVAGISYGGKAALEQDVAMRLLMSTSDGTSLIDDAIANLSPSTKRLLDRYSDGVNAWLADLEAKRNGAKRSAEFSLVLFKKDRVLEKWSARDSLAVGLYLLNELGNSTKFELEAADLAANIKDSDLLNDLLDVRPVFSEYVMQNAGITFGLDRPKLALEHLRGAKRAIHSALQLVRRSVTALGDGSNNWAVNKSMTANGGGLLANDPHLGFTNPATFFPVEIDATAGGKSDALHVAGGSVAGVPVVFVGRNASLAWGVTTAYYDLNEVYVEKLNAAGDAVIFNGQEVKLIRKEIAFKDLASGGEVKKTLEFVPHHGPLLSKDVANQRGISVRWVPATGLTDFGAFFALMRAKQVSDVPTALKTLTATNQNFVVVDAQGDIGWYPYAKIPARPWASLSKPPYLPVPGDGSAEWNGFVPLADLPQGKNPPNDRVITANNAITTACADGDATNDGQASLPYQSVDKAIGGRAAQIAKLIADGAGNHDMASMTRIQGDTVSQVGKLIMPTLLAAVSGKTLSADAQKVVDALKSWGFSCPTGLSTSDPKSAKSSDAAVVAESVGCSAFHMTLAQLVYLALADEAKAAGVEIHRRLRVKLVLNGIAQPSTVRSNFWDDVSTSATVETRDEIIGKAIAAAAVELLKIDSDPGSWLWGRLHTLTLASPLDAFGIKTYNHGPFASPGGLSTVNVGDPAALFKHPFPTGKGFPLDHTHGAALRMVAEGGGGKLKMTFELPGGTSGHRESPRYDQLLQKFLANQPVDFTFGKSELKDIDETIDVKPAQ